MNPTVQVAAIGDNVTFNCTVTNISQVTVTWMSNGINLSNQSSPPESHNGMVTLLLNLTNVTNGDYHTYKCSAKYNNDIIFASKSAILSKLPQC